MNFNDRFSLLLLEPGEIYFYDIAVKYQLPHKSQNEKEGWELLYFQEEIQGRLKICSKSLVFDSRIPQIPLIKFPLKHCHIIGKIGKYVNLSDSVDEYNNDDDNSTLELTCDLSIEMLENNVIKPFKFRKVRYTHMFNLNFTKPSEVLPLIQQLQRASTLPPNDHNVMVEAIVRSLQNRITFNYCNIKDIREKNVLELKASKVSPLVTNPGRVLVTDAALYYQPFNNLEKECLLRIPLVEFEQVIKRRFLLRHVGLEIFYKERNISRFLFLIFKDPEDRNDIYDCLMKQESLNLQNVDLPQETYKWQLGLISNYEYLMYLNSQADRSMNDLTQYPVFPWLISDYVSEDLNLSDEAVFRDMTKPVGALNEERLHKLRERFKDMPEPKFLYGSHYSTPGFVLFYLVRQYPLLMLCLQGGKFDHPDRMFNSLPDAWRNVTTSCSDFKELTPEFYDLESAGLFLKNDKAIPLGMRQSGQPVWDVSLPPWAKDPAHLVSTLRKALESDYVSYNLHHWIDLIFGYKQKGSEAVKADNVFYHLCYEGAVDVDSITDLQEKISVEVQIMEFGQIPKQIFTTPHPHKSRCLSLYNSISPLSCCELMKKASLSEVSELASEEENPKHILLYSQLSSLSSLGASRLHLQGIMHVMFIPSGNMLISLGKDGFLKAYSVPTLDKVGNLESGSLTLSCGVHLPGTNEILIGSWDNYLYRFNYKLCQKQDSLQAHSDAITCMDMNSEVLVTGSWDSLVRVWDITNLSYSQLPSGWSFWRLMMDHLICQMDHDQPVNRVAIHPQKDLFASGTTDGFINIWHLKKDIHFLSIHCHNGAVNGLYWSPDGGSVMSSSEDGKLILVETSSGNQISLFTLEEAAKSLLWDGRIAIVGTSLGAIVFVDVARDEILRTIIGHSDAILHPEEKIGQLCYGAFHRQDGGRGSEYYWEREGSQTLKMGGGGSKVKGNYLLETLGDHRDSINCMAVSEDQSLLATGSEDYTIRMWSTRTDETECLGELKGHTSYITCITICDTFVISGSFDASIRKWDMTTCECVFNFEGHQSRIGRVICSGEFVFSTSYDKTAKAWIFDAEETFDDEMDPDAGRKACIRTFKGHVKGVYSVIFIPAEDQFGVDESGLNINPGDILITGSADFDARSWSFDTSATLRVFKGHKGPITCMSTDPNGTILYTGSQDKDIRSWDIRTGRLLKVMSSHEGPVICLTVVDRLLYSGSQDGHAKCWVREFGDCTKTYRGHKHSIVALKLRDGILYTACGDTIIRAFDATSGAMRRMFQGHEAAVTCMTIIGEKLFSASLDSTLRVWNLKNIQKDPDEGDEEEETPDAAEQSFEKNQTRKLDEVDQRLDGYLSNEFIP